MKQLGNLLGMAAIGLATAMSARAMHGDASVETDNVTTRANAATDVDAWIARVRSAGALDRTSLERVMREVDASFGRARSREVAPCDDATQFVSADVQWGQLDTDADREAVVHVVYASPSFQSERCEEHWVGFFDRRANRMTLTGSVENLLSYCEIDHAGEGERVGFVSDGGRRGAWLQTQQTIACNARSTWRYERRVYQLRRDELVAL
jgi:hypothetical protein